MRRILQTLFFFLLVTQICFAQWYEQNSGTTKNLNAIQFVDENTGWAVGDSGLILQTADGGLSWITVISGTTENLNDVQIVNADIGWIVGGTWYGSYPPYNFTAVVLNVLGNEIVILVDEYKLAGRDDVEFNTLTLPSGVYFYQLKAGEYTAVKKMLLIK